MRMKCVIKCISYVFQKHVKWADVFEESSMENKVGKDNEEKIHFREHFIGSPDYSVCDIL